MVSLTDRWHLNKRLKRTHWYQVAFQQHHWKVWNLVKNVAIPDGFNCGHQGSSTLLAQLGIFLGWDVSPWWWKVCKTPSGLHKSPSCLCDITYVWYHCFSAVYGCDSQTLYVHVTHKSKAVFTRNGCVQVNLICVYRGSTNFYLLTLIGANKKKFYFCENHKSYGCFSALDAFSTCIYTDSYTGEIFHITVYGHHFSTPY